MNFPHSIGAVVWVIVGTRLALLWTHAAQFGESDAVGEAAAAPPAMAQSEVLGKVTFNNAMSSRVWDDRTGQPVEPGVAVAGLYYSLDLDAVPNPCVPKDTFQLAAVTLISPSTVFSGIFNGGSVAIPGTVPGQAVLLQIRVWPAQYQTYEEAMQSASPWVAASHMMGPITLGGGLLPTPRLASEMGFAPMTLTSVPENPPPIAYAMSFSLGQSGSVTGQLQGADPEGKPITFVAITQPSDGTLSLQTDGQFTYVQLPDAANADFFTFQVHDATSNSAPALVSIKLDPKPTVGMLIMRNTPITAIMDIRTGLPVEPGVAVAGLYYSTNLSAEPDPTVPKDAFDLAVTTPASIGPFNGVFSVTRVAIPGTLPGQRVRIQIRAWLAEYPSYEEALLHSGILVAVSPSFEVMLGGGMVPLPNTSTRLNSPMLLGPVPGQGPPLAQDMTFTVEEDTVLEDQLTAFSAADLLLTYSLVSTSTLGSVSLQSNGQFTYAPFGNVHGTDSFLFQADDGLQPSEPATVQIHIQAINDPPVAVIQIAPVAEIPLDPDRLFLIAPHQDSAVVLLDGSLSCDVEGDSLNYAWFTEPGLVPLAQGHLMATKLEVGLHTVTLLVDDGRDVGLASVSFEVITVGAAVDDLIAEVDGAGLASRNKPALLASLKAASESFDRGQSVAGVHQLRAFQRKLDTQIVRLNPDLARQWNQWVRVILGAVEGEVEAPQF